MATKYNLVRRAIEKRIKDGTYLPHQKIHSESELMKEFGVSRHTVRLVIGDLVTEGVLYRIQGSGTFCADLNNQHLHKHKPHQKNIAIITTYISDYIFPSIIRGAESRLSQEGYQVSLFSTNNNHEKEKEILEKIIEQKFDGVIIEPTKSAFSNPNINYYLHLEHLNIPYIMINAHYDELDPVSLEVDDEKGGFLQTEHLINLGHKNIIGCFKTDDKQGVNRMKGFLRAHRHYNIPLNPKNVITYYTENKNSKPIEELNELLKGKFPYTGLVCYNDELVIKVLNLLRLKNIQVPKDLSIVGFDNSILTDVSEVKITSIEHPKSELGKRAAEVILQLIKDSNNQQKQKKKIARIMYEPELVKRQSTRPLE
jgi:GntR family transcriptional regulator, arabinose operon transcriptional repressor